MYGISSFVEANPLDHNSGGNEGGEKTHFLLKQQSTSMFLCGNLFQGEWMVEGG